MKAQDIAIEFLLRKMRLKYPDGRSDNGGRWYPYPKETAPCCASISGPTRSWPWSLMKHCCTLKHLCTLYNVSEGEVRFFLGKKGLPVLMGFNSHIDKYIINKLKV